MIKIYPTAIIEENVKIGRLNLPTIALSMILLAVFTIFAMKSYKQPNEFLFGIFFISGLIASAFGVVILIWCFFKRKQFASESVKNYFWQTVLGSAKKVML